MSEPVEIADYDPRWPSLFEEEKARIAGAVSHLILDVEHIGATSVPGCGGKPIIDIMIGVRHLAAVEKCVPLLEGAGYEYRGEAGIPGRLFFRRRDPSTGRRLSHLHVVRRDSEFWREHALFRDFLRAHPEEVTRYYELKKELAAKFGADREGYTEAKTPLIQSALNKARAASASSSARRAVL